MKLAIPVLIALVLGYFSTVYQGNVTERWNQDEVDRELAVASKRIEAIPRFVGDWKGVDTEADPNQLKAARIVGDLSRDFRNVRTGKSVSFFLVCGRPRHVAIHTPDDCYVAAGFEMLNKPETIEIETEDGTVEFYTTVFKKVQGNETHQVRVFWSWSSKGTWEAPEYPRIAYARGSALYKMYIIAPVSTVNDTEFDDSNPTVQFIKAIIPATDNALFPKKATAASSSDGDSEQARSSPRKLSAPQEQPAA